MKALILAAGYATRLYPYTKNFPKPLLDVGGRPVIDYLADKILEIGGVSKIIVVTNDKFTGHFKKWRASHKRRAVISIVNDGTKTPEERLGAVGDMRLVFEREKYKGAFLVLGGDNYFEEPLAPFISFCRKHKGASSIGVFDIGSLREARNYGVVKVGRNSRVLAFHEKPARPSSTLIGMCLYYFPQGRARMLKEYLSDSSHNRDAAGAYIKWLAAHSPVYGYRFRKRWVDIGSIQAYQQVQTVTKGARG
jgi:glucose-1-phosphate thymidylyltransferase